MCSRGKRTNDETIMAGNIGKVVRLCDVLGVAAVQPIGVGILVTAHQGIHVGGQVSLSVHIQRIDCTTQEQDA